MSTRKHHIHHWGVIVLGIVLINTVLFFGVQYVSRPVISSTEQARKENKYTEVIQLASGNTSLRTAPSYVKLGDIEAARDAFLVGGYEGVPGWRDVIRKAMLLWSKDDIVGAQELLAHSTDKDPVVRSLFLSIRGYFFCLQKKREECGLLAEDSIKLDSLAPFGLQLEGIVNNARREFTKAQDLFTRAEKGGMLCKNVLCLYARGVTRFYNGQYSGAILDLTNILDDEAYGYEARLFLGRTYFNQKEFLQAKEWFERSRDFMGGTDRTSELRLARVATEEGDIDLAMNIYADTYASGEYGVELITDYLALAYFTYNADLVTTLSKELEPMVRNSPWNYLLVVKVFEQINNLDLAKKYLQKGLVLVDEIEELDEQERYVADYLREENNIHVREIYDLFASGTLVDEELFTQVDALSLDVLHGSFLRGFQSVILQGVDPENSGFQRIPQITSRDIPVIRFWYVLFRGNTKRALEILTGIEGFEKNDSQLLWMKWAVTQRLGEKQLADRYMYQLKEMGVLGDTSRPFTQHELRKQAFRAYTPWMKWMSPYFSLDFWWIEKPYEEEKIKEI